jgi:glycine/D-amino acid oxidase-like deaminating enzyme
MDQGCEIAIVGAGVIGCSVAFQLGRMGQRGVRLLER